MIAASFPFSVHVGKLDILGQVALGKALDDSVIPKIFRKAAFFGAETVDVRIEPSFVPNFSKKIWQFRLQRR
jgi:hypothetical protein